MVTTSNPWNRLVQDTKDLGATGFSYLQRVGNMKPSEFINHVSHHLQKVRIWIDLLLIVIVLSIFFYLLTKASVFINKHIKVDTTQFIEEDVKSRNHICKYDERGNKLSCDYEDVTPLSID